MRNCFNENVSVYETEGKNLGTLLIEAAGLVDKHDGIARVLTEPQTDPDTGDFTYVVTVLLHG